MENVQVLLFGRLADLAGSSLSVQVASEGCTIAELRVMVGDRHSQLGEELVRPEIRAVVGDEIVPDDFRIFPGQEVEFFPPLSGG